MASPIRWFRKHSQVMIVVFGVLLMAIFGLGSVLTGLNPGDLVRRGEDRNEVVAKWAHGEFKRNDLAGMLHRQEAALQLLNQLELYAIEQNDGKPVAVTAQRISRIFRPGEKQNVNNWHEQMLNRYLLAKRAEQEGLVVNETMVYEYIAQFAGDIPVTRNLLKQINRQVNPNVQLTPIIRHLQIELLAQQMDALARGGLPFDLDQNNPVSFSAINPTEAIQLYARTNKRIESQVLPVSVAEYVSKVEEVPTDAVLRQLYEKGKYEYPSFNFENPGFKMLKQARVQYFVGELETFLQNEIAKLTDEEVQNEYDRLVAADDDLVMEIVVEEPETRPADNAQEPESEGTKKEDADESDAAPAPDAESQDKVPAREPEESDSGTEDGSSESANADATGSDAANESSDGDGDVEKTNTSLVQDSDTPQETDDSDPVIADEPRTDRRPKPLKDVAEDVKRQMKMEAARIARDQAMEQAEKELRKFQMKQSQWESRSQRNEKMEKPVPPDFQKIADELNVQFIETGLINQTQIGDEKIGKVVSFDVASRQFINTGEDIFNRFETTEVYEPAKVDDFTTNSRLIYWMAEKVEQKVPDFDEARESIIEYWKHEQGVELAKQEAQKIADEINASEKLLKDVYPETALDTGAFAWFSSFGQFAYGAPAGVQNPGEEFMSKAFSLAEREAGVALNEMRDTVYVIQPNTAYNMSLEQLGTDYIEKNFFLTRRIPPEVLSAKRVYQQRMNFEWFIEFLDSMEVNVVGQ